MTNEKKLEIQKHYDKKMNAYQAILDKAKKSEGGLVSDNEKTEEWHKAKRMFDFYKKIIENFK